MVKLFQPFKSSCAALFLQASGTITGLIFIFDIINKFDSLILCHLYFTNDNLVLMLIRIHTGIYE